MNLMKSSILLWLDALINALLGILLILFPPSLVDLLGVPPSAERFYPTILGAVFLGIAIALVLEARRAEGRLVGLGVGGAAAINLCGGLMLAGWLVSGTLDLPIRGQVILWGLVAVLVGISSLEIVAQHAARSD